MPPVPMIQIVANTWVAQAVFVSAKLGIADVLADGPTTTDELARRIGTHPQATYRLLRMLASVGIFREEDDGRYANNETSESLREGADGAQRATIIAMIELGWSAWGELLACVKTGDPAFERIHGKPRYQMLDEDVELSRMFDRSLSAPARVAATAVATAYDFSGFERIVDVGGGDGALLREILRKAPLATGVLFERASVIAEAGAIERCELVGGDFHTDPVPSGDAIVLKSVLHNWNDEQARSILDRCRAAMPEGGKLLVVEPLIPRGNEPSFHKLADVHMLVIHGGRERSLDEYARLLAAAGLRISRTVSCGTTDLIEAERA